MPLKAKQRDLWETARRNLSSRTEALPFITLGYQESQRSDRASSSMPRAAGDPEAKEFIYTYEWWFCWSDWNESSTVRVASGARPNIGPMMG